MELKYKESHNSAFELVQVEIDARRLAKYTWIFRVEELVLVEFLEVRTDGRHVDADEYLVLHCIRKSAILGGMSFAELQQTG